MSCSSCFEQREGFGTSRKHFFPEASAKKKKKNWTKFLKKSVRKWVMKLKWMCMTSHWVSLSGIKHSLSLHSSHPPLPLFFFLNLCNYSNYGISNTPDIFQRQQDQNQPWETLFFMWSRSGGRGVTGAVSKRPALCRALKNLRLRRGTSLLFFSVFCSTPQAHPFMRIFGCFAGWTPELPELWGVSFYQPCSCPQPAAG